MAYNNINQTIQSVYDQCVFSISTVSPEATQQLIDRKSINAMKIKRSSKRGNIKKAYTAFINELEIKYNKNYGK